MPTQTVSPQKRVTRLDLLTKKQQGEKIVTLTAYDYSMAKLLDAAGVDVLLVGDSLGMVVLGYETTLSVTMEDMLHHVKAVTRGAKHAMVVADMPFLSYQVEQTEAVRNAGRLLQEGMAHAVKLEGASPFILKVVEHLVSVGIPVMGHLGYTPQATHQTGGPRVQGKTLEGARTLLDEALALQQAGVFALVLEMVPREVAALIQTNLDIPTIGIGSGPDCDGQVLVIDDLLGKFQDFTPKFVRRYLHEAEATQEAVSRFIQDVKTQDFPNASESYSLPAEVLTALTAHGNL